MPKKFTRMYGQELSSKALLTVPNGGVWQVGLEKANGQIWFCDGWNKFIDYYSIKFGFLLLFKYEGDSSSFQVLIFDRSASEIQYPHGDHGMEVGDEVERDDSIISIPSSSGSSSDDRYDDDECRYQPHFSKVTCTNLEFDSTNKCVETRSRSKRKLEICGQVVESKRCKVAEDCIKMEDFDVVKNDPRRNLSSQNRTAALSGREMTLQAAIETLKTRNPSFLVSIHHRNIEKCYAYIPSSFATKYLSSKKEIVEIQDGSKGRKWKIDCDRSGSTSKRMGRGWRVFCRENNLRAGDLVVFELVKRSNNRVMKFTVFSSAAL